MKKYLVILVIFLLACGKKTEETTQQVETQIPQITTSGLLSWSAPEGWIKETPTSSFRKAQYRLPKAENDPEDATCVLFYFRGEGGGVQANIHRWYSQFTQPDGRLSKDVATVKKSTVNGLPQTMIDLSGTYLFKTSPMAATHTEKPNFRMLAVVVESSRGPWFVKLVGPKKTVSKWEDSLYDFMKSFKE